MSDGTGQTSTVPTPTYKMPTALGPLTTSFLQPTDCQYFGNATSMGGHCVGNGLLNDPSCWPPATVAPPPSGWLSSCGWYSPGLACPIGYTAACKSTYNAAPSISQDVQSIRFDGQLLPSETAIGCCPSGFSCNGRQYNPDCIMTSLESTVSSTTYLTAKCSAGAFVERGSQPVPSTSTLSNGGQLIVRNFALSAPLVQLRYQSSDWKSLAPYTSDPFDPSPTSTTTSTSISAAAPPKAGLTRGSTIAIAAIMFGVVRTSVAAAFTLLCRQRRQRKRSQVTVILRELDSGAQISELDSRTQTPELDIGFAVELGNETVKLQGDPRSARG